MIGRIVSLLIVIAAPLLVSGQRLHESRDVETTPGVIVVKVKGSSSNMRTAGETSPIDFIRKNFSPGEIAPVLPSNARARKGATQSGIERIFTVTLDGNENISEVIEKIESLDGIEYAEPLYQNELLYIPNDPHANPTSGNQYYLNNIGAYKAWDIEKGDTNVVVGIVDTGADLAHADLFPNIYINHDDPINGIDDDGDGYIDNYIGWDIADNDNDAHADTHAHGTFVSGISSAKTNNGLGISGVGFNTRFMPVKIMENSSGRLRNEYAGVIYAANQGVKVINLSWGSAWGYSKFAQDVINFAVLDMDVVVVAAAGNTHDHIDFYPASFDNVLSVTSSDAADNFSNWATYSYKVDLMAPGHAMYSTKNGNSYGSVGNGTSYAAPVVAGAAALVRSKYPHLNAIQVAEQLRVSTDDVSHIGANSTFEGEIGRGRLNIHKALSDTTMPSVRLNAFEYTGQYGKHIFPGDTIKINTSFINYLSEAKGLTISLSTVDTNAVSHSKAYHINSLKNYEVKDISEDPWQVVMAESLQPNTRIYFRIDYEVGDFRDYEYFYVTSSPSFFDVVSNNFSMTISGDGSLAYEKDALNWGNGVWNKFDRISNHMGVIISRNDDYVANNVVNNYTMLTKDKDFEAVTNARMHNNSLADVDVRSKFREKEHIYRMGIEVEQKALAWHDHTENHFSVLEYRLINTSDSILDKLNMAFYADYDLRHKDYNTADYDASTGLAYSFNAAGTQLFAGLALLTPGDSTVYAIDKASYNGNSADFDVHFTDSLKYEFSTSSMEKTQAGAGLGNDVANLVGIKNLTLQPGESKKVAFAVMSGPSLEHLRAQLTRAKNKYQEYMASPPVDYTVFSCKDGDATLYPKTGEAMEVYADASLAHRIDSTDAYYISSITKDTTYFIVEIENGMRQDTRRAIVRMIEPQADFIITRNPLLISGEALDTIRFMNASAHADRYSWDFGNGYFGKVENPIVQYTTPGTYQITLAAHNATGCSDTITKTLEVVMRSPKPLVDDLTICKWEEAAIMATNTSHVRVYADEGLTQPLFEGKIFVSQPLEKATTFYVTNADGPESLPVAVQVRISNPDADFIYSVALEDNRHLLKVENTSPYAENLHWEINNQVLEDSQVLLYDYSNDDMVNILLSAYDSLSCVDSKILALIPSKSPMPVVENMEVCANSNATIAPKGGTNFLFYSDASATSLIGSGTEMTFGPITKDTIVYITNIDSLKESDPVAVQVNIIAFKAHATARPENIDLSQTNSVELFDFSTGAQESYWVLDNGTIDTAKAVSQHISEPGEYQFTLVARLNEYCVDTATVTVNASMVTSVAPTSYVEEVAAEISLYPNPARNHVNIRLTPEHTYNQVDIVDYSGKVVYHRPLEQISAIVEINTSGISNGIYLLRLHGQNESKVIRLAINQ